MIVLRRMPTSVLPIPVVTFPCSTSVADTFASGSPLTVTVKLESSVPVFSPLMVNVKLLHFSPSACILADADEVMVRAASPSTVSVWLLLSALARKE